MLCPQKNTYFAILHWRMGINFISVTLTYFSNVGSLFGTRCRIYRWLRLFSLEVGSLCPHWLISLVSASSSPFPLFLYLAALLMFCTSLHSDSAVRFTENRRFLFCPFQVVKMDISGTTSFYHLYCTLTEHPDIPHATAKIQVTLSTTLHTGTKRLPRKLRFCICYHPFSSKIFFSVNWFALVRSWHMWLEEMSQSSFEQFTVAWRFAH
jgi:hypothetical protein